MYLSTSVDDVPLTISKFAACIADINAWLSTCRLRLNAAKTQLLWLSSSQLLDKVDCRDVGCQRQLTIDDNTEVTSGVRDGDASAEHQDVDDVLRVDTQYPCGRAL